MSANTPPAARLLNLVIALMNTPVRMTKDEIRTSVAGYDEPASTKAFERMFERDKDSLRGLGVPIVTVEPDGHTEDIGYRIDKDSYALDEVDLTPAELGVLSLAAQFWQDAAVAVDTTRALTKLRSAGEMDSGPAGEGTDAVAGLAPRVRTVAAAYEPLLDAILARRVVVFTYRAANTGEVRRRTVEPWKVAVRDGGWYLLGHDRDRRAARSFRLTRIEGSVRAIGERGAFTIPAEIDVDQLVGGAAPAPVRHALLALRPERASALRARGSAATPLGPDRAALARAVADRELVMVGYTSTHAMADEVAGYGEAVLVLEPLELRTEVLDRLRAAAALPLTPTTSGDDRG
ncbi:transcriptional regulator [Sanguibacter gelidistatuariae]|uniref:Transcriptional regulator n=1 Tax=Sanguibacter gelidistatuariae TaxID=1814289 RepID=A0A1G6JDT9_9MICO|nr:WYL domain-containing protein [Sanguibacter gelidistatuariae]SDC16861.1 transcriptional regulator [Sanguibacter gelidistatuariae]